MLVITPLAHSQTPSSLYTPPPPPPHTGISSSFTADTSLIHAPQAKGSVL